MIILIISRTKVPVKYLYRFSITPLASRGGVNNQTDHLKKCVLKFSEIKIKDDRFLSFSVLYVVAYDFFIRDPEKVEQLRSEVGVFLSFHFFWKSIKTLGQFQDLKKILQEIEDNSFVALDELFVVVYSISAHTFNLVV